MTSRAANRIHLADATPANSNWPIVRLRRVGDGRELVRALVEVLVRRALINEGVIRDGQNCKIQDLTG